MPDEPALYALFLAAGEGRRFGAPKLLRPHRGRPLVAYALDTIGRARADGLIQGGVAVIPARNTVLRQLSRDRGLRVVLNADPDQGISHTLQLGLGALGTLELLPPPTAALLILGDQPRVPPATIGRLIEAWRGGAGPMVGPAYRDGRGPDHPVIIDRGSWPVVEALSGDAGIAEVMAQHPKLVTTIEIDGVNPDIDTPDDLAQLDSE
ncbi:MAG: nucleotidyltransferase family protein [Gemmatimonadales bacterium]